MADDAWLQTGRSDVISRWARKPPRTARQKGRRIARRHRLRTVPTGKRKLQTSLSSGLQTRATRFRWRAMVFTQPLRMPIEIREGIVESESEELLLHAPFVQHATPVDAFAQPPCQLRIKVAQSPMPQANSAIAFFATFLNPHRMATAPDQPHTPKIGSNPTPPASLGASTNASLSCIPHQQLNHRPRRRRLPPMRRIDHRERP